MKLRLPAGDGNTCYRSSVDTGEVRDRFQEILSELNRDVRLSFEDVMVSTREFEDRGVLVIESHELSYWIEQLDEDVREWWRTEGKPALNAGEFNVLCQEPLLKPLLRRVLNDCDAL